MKQLSEEVLQKQKLTPFFFTGRTSEATKMCFLPGKHPLFRTGLAGFKGFKLMDMNGNGCFPGPKKCCLCWFIPKVNSKTSRLLCCFRKVPCWNLKLGNNGENIPPEIWRTTTQKWPKKNGVVSCFLKTPYFRVSNGIYENEFRW